MNNIIESYLEDGITPKFLFLIRINFLLWGFVFLFCCLFSFFHVLPPPSPPSEMKSCVSHCIRANALATKNGLRLIQMRLATLLYPLRVEGKFWGYRLARSYYIGHCTVPPYTKRNHPNRPTVLNRER